MKSNNTQCKSSYTIRCVYREAKGALDLVLGGVKFSTKKIDIIMCAIHHFVVNLTLLYTEESSILIYGLQNYFSYNFKFYMPVPWIRQFQNSISGLAMFLADPDPRSKQADPDLCRSSSFSSNFITGCFQADAQFYQPSTIC